MTADIVFCNAGVTEIGQVTDTREKKSMSKVRNRTPSSNLLTCQAQLKRWLLSHPSNNTANSLGTYPTQPILKTLQINGNGMLLTAEIAKTEWEKEASSSPGGNRPRGPGKLILLASFGKSIKSSQAASV